MSIDCHLHLRRGILKGMKITVGQLRQVVKEVTARPKGLAFWGRAGAGILFVCPDDDTILLGKRAAWVEDPGTWGAPGGSVDGGWRIPPIDDPVEDMSVFHGTALRETEEECGSLPSGLSLSRFISSEKMGFRYVTYLARLTSEQKAEWQPVAADGETDEWVWFPLDSLPDPVHPKLMSALRRFGLLT